MAKAEEKSSFFKDVSIDQALNVCQKVYELFDQCRFAQLDKKVTLTCAFANLQNRNS